MDLFGFVNLKVPKSATIGVRLKRDDEEPLLEATRGRVVELVIPELEGSPSVGVVEPIQEVAPAVQQEPNVAQPPPNSVNRAIVDLEESDEKMEKGGLQTRRKRARSVDGEGSSKRPRSDVGPSFATLEMGEDAEKSEGD